MASGEYRHRRRRGDESELWASATAETATDVIGDVVVCDKAAHQRDGRQIWPEVKYQPRCASQYNKGASSSSGSSSSNNAKLAAWRRHEHNKSAHRELATAPAHRTRGAALDTKPPYNNNNNNTTRGNGTGKSPQTTPLKKGAKEDCAGPPAPAPSRRKIAALRPSSRLSTELVAAVLDFVVEPPPRPTTARLWPVTRQYDAAPPTLPSSSSERRAEYSRPSRSLWRRAGAASSSPIRREEEEAAAEEPLSSSSSSSAWDVRVDGEFFAASRDFDALRASGAAPGPFEVRGHWVARASRDARRSFLCVEPAPLDVATTSWRSLRSDRIDWLRRVSNDDDKGDRVVCCSVTRDAVGALVAARRRERRSRTRAAGIFAPNDRDDDDVDSDSDAGSSSEVLSSSDRSADDDDSELSEDSGALARRAAVVEADAIGYDYGARGRVFRYVPRGAALSRRLRERFAVSCVAYHRLSEFSPAGTTGDAGFWLADDRAAVRVSSARRDQDDDEGLEDY